MKREFNQILEPNKNYLFFHAILLVITLKETDTELNKYLIYLKDNRSQ